MVMRTIQRCAAWLCCLCLVPALSCVDEQAQGVRVTPERHKGVEARPFFAEPIVLPSSSYVMIPFWMYVPQAQGKIEWFSGSSWSGSYAQMSVGLSKSFGSYLTTSGHWNNLIFNEKGTDKCHLLLDHKAVISRAWFPAQLTKSMPEVLLFAIAEQDTNGDGYINSDDAVALYSSAMDGSGLTRLTPAGTQLTDIVDGGTVDLIYVRVLRDSNGDHRFVEGQDEAEILRVDLRRREEGKAILDQETKRQARRIIEEK